MQWDQVGVMYEEAKGAEADQCTTVTVECRPRFIVYEMHRSNGEFKGRKKKALVFLQHPAKLHKASFSSLPGYSTKSIIIFDKTH